MLASQVSDPIVSSAIELENGMEDDPSETQHPFRRYASLAQILCCTLRS